MIVNMFILLYSHSMVMARGVLARDLSAAYSLLSPTPISPIAAPSEEQKEYEDNKNEVHIFLQNNLTGVFPPAHVDAEFYSPASDSTYASVATWGMWSGLHYNLKALWLGNNGPSTSSGRSRRESGTARRLSRLLFAANAGRTVEQ
jgi:hypothetical protein